MIAKSDVSRPSDSGALRNPTPRKCLMAKGFQGRLRAPRDFRRTKVLNARNRHPQIRPKSLGINIFHVCAHLPHFGQFRLSPVTVAPRSWIAVLDWLMAFPHAHVSLTSIHCHHRRTLTCLSPDKPAPDRGDSPSPEAHRISQKSRRSSISRAPTT